MNLEELKRRKSELGYTNERIAELSGVPLSTVQKVFAGVTAQPRYDTMMALERVLCPDGAMVRESIFSYSAAGGHLFGKKQGEYTLEDLEKLPEDVHAELIDGILYISASPTLVHQMILMEIWQTVRNHIRKNKGQCIAVTAPSDVMFHKEDTNLYQPDLYVVCDRSKLVRGGVIGVPDLIVEILSPSTKKKDMLVKLSKYLENGVREYWQVDPEGKRILVYGETEDADDVDLKIYGFDDVVPVGIFDNQCQVDFRQIYEEIAFLYELKE